MAGVKDLRAKYADDPFAEGLSGPELRAYDQAQRGHEREERRRGRRQVKPLRDAYQRGRRDARKPKSSTGQRRRRQAPRSVRRGVQQLQQPIAAQVTSGVRVLGLTLIVVALYVALSEADRFAGFIGGVGRGLNWLTAPDRSIPYRLPAGGAPSNVPAPGPLLDPDFAPTPGGDPLPGQGTV